jgi:hypothetical protein
LRTLWATQSAATTPARLTGAQVAGNRRYCRIVNHINHASRVSIEIVIAYFMIVKDFVPHMGQKSS